MGQSSGTNAKVSAPGCGMGFCQSNLANGSIAEEQKTQFTASSAADPKSAVGFTGVESEAATALDSVVPEKQPSTAMVGAGSIQLQREDTEELGTTKPLNIHAQHVTMADLKQKIRICAKVDREAEELTRSLESVAELLAKGIGGMMVAVVHENCLSQPLFFNFLDGGIHTQCMRDCCKSMYDDSFAHFLHLLTAHNDTDRWEEHELKALREKVPQTASYCQKLKGQPKDGGIFFSHRGHIKGAAMNIKHPSTKLQLLKSNGTAAGTRHASALGLAEHLSKFITADSYPGVVFARSDGGGAHAFFPEANEQPTVLAFETLKVPSQAFMLNHFKELIKKQGKLMRKDLPVLARPGKLGETVVTSVDGEVTSKFQIEQESMVLRGNTPSQEFYALRLKAFEKNYEMPGIDPLTSEDTSSMSRFLRSSLDQLAKRGFKLYTPRQGQYRWVYRVTEKDMEGIPTHVFQAAWDPAVLQPVRTGTILGMPEDASEIYYMPQSAFQNYIAVDAITHTDTEG